MLRAVLLLLSGNALGSLMLLIRNLAIARLITVEDYGIAATFAVSMAVVEMAANLGLQQLIVQDKDGNDPDLQAGLQGLNLLRSLFSGVILFLLAHPIAQFLGIPELAWAYQLLALVPALRGLEHFDIYRLNRKMQFRPLIMTKTVPALISVLCVWPLYRSFGDYRVMLYAVLIQWVLAVIISHLVAERRYRLALDRKVILRGLHFGWPLLISNILLFAVFQGDKLIVGRELGMESLAVFAMGVTLTLTPTLVMGSSEQQFFLPQISAVTNDCQRFAQLAMTAMQTSLISGLVLVVSIVLLGPQLIHLLLGGKYDALTPLITWLAILQAIRTFRVGCTTVALSQAFTANPMVGNSFRVLTLPFVWQVAIDGGTLQQIIWIAIIGELCGYFAALLLVRYRLKLSLRRMALPILATFFMLAAVGTHTLMSTSPDYPVVWSAALMGFVFLLVLSTMKEIFSYIALKMA